MLAYRFMLDDLHECAKTILVLQGHFSFQMILQYILHALKEEEEKKFLHESKHEKLFCVKPSW